MEEPFQTTYDCQHDNLILPNGWRAILVENNRWYYLQETRKNCCWLPPAKSWRSRRQLPYGWETARSNDGRRYYINHMTKETSHSLPSSSSLTLTASVTPRTRKVVISRHSDIGYGFVAGSEKPVLIRSVAEDGPSAGKLHANDQILKINDEDVHDLPQADVILRIKNYTEELRLEVIANDDVQDVKNQGQRKSSIMSRTTRERRRSHPVSVRFADAPVLVQYVGSPPSYPLRRSSMPLLPNVLKIFLENGQTRSFRYTSSTTIKELLMSLGEKIGLKTLDRFSLVLQSSQSLNSSFVQPSECASQIYLRRNTSSSTWLCKFHLILAPKDIPFLLKANPIAFDYFYKQVCSQVVEGRFGGELKYETAIKLAALHLQQYALEEKVGKGSKISVKAIEKEVGGLDSFVPKALINTMQKKDLQRVLAQQMKQTRNLCPPGQKNISPLQAKLQYLKIVSEMKTYGGKQFNAIILDPTEDPKAFQDEKLPSVIFVGPNVGLAQVTNPRSFSMSQIAAFNQISGLVVTPHTEGKQNVKLFLNNSKSVTLILGPIYETRDLVYLISGYCKYLAENAKSLSIIDMTGTERLEESVDQVPSYSQRHRVVPDEWNYKEKSGEELKEIDFGQKPKFDGSEMYTVVTGGREDSESSSQSHVSNGDVKPNFRIQQDDMNNVGEDLERVTEESSSPQTKDAGASIDFGKVADDPDKVVDDPDKVVDDPDKVVDDPDKVVDDPDKVVDDPDKVVDDPDKVADNPDKVVDDHDKVVDDVDGRPAGRKSVVQLSDDLRLESTEEEVPEKQILPTPKFKTKKSDSNKVTSAQNGLVIILRDEVPVASVDDLPEFSAKSNHDSKSLGRDDPATDPISTESAEIDISCNGDDSISSRNHQASGDVSLTTSLSPTSNDIEMPHSKDVTTPLSDLTLNDKQDGINNSSNKDRDDNNGDNNNKNRLNEDASAGDQVTTANIDTSAENLTPKNTPQYFISDNKENDAVTIDLNIKRNASDVKTSDRLRHRRRSSGYIPSPMMNGDIPLFTPECIILDDTIPKLQESTVENIEAEIASRSKACDHALKKLYSLKTKLSTLLHSKQSLRTRNDVLRAKKQLMVDKITVLEECINQIHNISSTEEIKVIEAVLKLSRALDLLTESCSVLYNGQFSMRNFATELDDVIGKHIDVLITTDAWNSTDLSNMTVELHRDKCDLVCLALSSVLKIINAL